MFDFTTEVKTKEQSNTDESCYGGMVSRLSYEQSRSAFRAARITKAILLTAVCLMMGLSGVLAGIMVYEMVKDNPLYYPGTQRPTLVTSAPAAPETAAPAHSGFSAISDGTQPMSGAENVTAELAKKYRIPMGVMLHIVEVGSAAALAGMEAGDIIVAVGGTETKDLETLTRLLAESADEVSVTVFRNNRYYTLTMKNEK